jgi:hypothetical protein
MDPTPKIVEIHDDNIADDDSADDQLEQFIKDTESASLADLYIRHLSSGQKSTVSHNLPPNRILDDVTAPHSYHPATAGYSDYSLHDYIGQTQKKKSRKSRTRTDVQNSIDLLGDQVESILDCVKSTDQIINDIHERQLGVGDTIEELQEHARGTTMRTVELNSRMTELEKNQKAIMLEQVKTTEALSQIAKLLQVVHLNVKFIRWGDNEE